MDKYITYLSLSQLHKTDGDQEGSIVPEERIVQEATRKPKDQR